MIASRLGDYEKYHQPITGRKMLDYHHAIYDTFKVVEQSSTAVSLVTKRMLNHYELFLQKNVIETYNDDILYTILAILNGFHFVCCSDYAIWVDSHLTCTHKIQFQNAVCPLSKTIVNGDYRKNSYEICRRLKAILEATKDGMFKRNVV